jgi:fermentation-respiration switch protein FrsA (DUF1100 family)
MTHMIDPSIIHYPALDRPEITAFLFYPRPECEPGGAGRAEGIHMIPVEDGVSIGARFHLVDPAAPNLLFFHGNGEIVSDYDDIAGLYARIAINFLPVDYRGYGRSGGRPTVTAMMRDAHIIFASVRRWLADNRHTGPLIVMGRSLGSASALELASHYPDSVDGLIIESGFAHALPLLRLLGVDTDKLGITEGEAFDNTSKIARYPGPTLVIHAEFDHIIPFADGEALFAASPDPDKRFLEIPEANHNDIFLHGIEPYLEAVRRLASRCTQKSAL